MRSYWTRVKQKKGSPISYNDITFLNQSDNILDELFRSILSLNIVALRVTNGISLGGEDVGENFGEGGFT
jgi:hypothetical protein